MALLSTWCCWLVLKPSFAKSETEAVLIWGPFCAVEGHLISHLHAVASKPLEPLLQLDESPVTKASQADSSPWAALGSLG